VIDLLLSESKNGKSVVANRNFKKDEHIIELHGELFTYKQLPTPYEEVVDHYTQIGSDLYLGPSGGLDDFVNHSCNPNSGIKVTNKKVVLIAIKNIPKGQEITFDYSTTMDEDDWEMNCKCGSQYCRKSIKDFKYLPKEIQEKYIKLGIVPKFILK
jgi:SET domain-containing protein